MNLSNYGMAQCIVFRISVDASGHLGLLLLLHIHFLETYMVVCIFSHRFRLFGLKDMQLLWNVYGAVCVKQQRVHRSSKLFISCEFPKTSYL